MTWNCTHLANAEIMVGVRRLLAHKGYAPPVVCLPEELLGEQ